MRFHRRYPLLQVWFDVPQARAVMQPRHLAIARFEPAIAAGVRGSALLDLIFSDGSSTGAIVNVEVEPEMLLERERSPLIWPHAAGALGSEILEDLEQVILPWLESVTFARQANEELMRTFSGAIDPSRFAHARESRFLGAARYADSMAAFAPYVYAARFCSGNDVGVRDPYGASGAAMLERRAKSVRSDLGCAAANDLAGAWFGRAIFGSQEHPCQVSISAKEAEPPGGAVTITLERVPKGARETFVASPVPVDVLVSFDREDAPPAYSFGVLASEEAPLRPVPAVTQPAAAGGSTGTIVMLLRDNFAAAEDSDADEARALAARLREEGFSVELASPSTFRALERVDLVHVFAAGALSAEGSLPALLRERGVPVVATASLCPAPQETLWGPQVLRAVLSRSPDEAVLGEHLGLLARRRLNSGTAPQDAVALRSLLEHVDAAIVTCAQEEAQLRGVYGFSGEAVRGAPYVPASTAPPKPITALTGNWPFALVHAPVEWRANLPLLARAAAALAIPVVAVGQTIDVDALRAAQRAAPEALIHLPEAGAGEIEALYRRARVFVDVSWAPAGLARVARAVRGGCHVVLSGASYAGQVWPGAQQADPASVASIQAALEAAWNGAGALPAQDASLAFSAVITAYAKAQQARQSA